MPKAQQPLPLALWVMVCSAFLIALGFGIVAPVIPQFARSFDVTFFAASAIVSIFALVRLVFAPAGGVLVNKFGERRIYLIGLSIVALASLMSGLAPNYGLLLAARGVGGLGSVMFTVSSMGLLVRLSPDGQRGRVASLYGSSFLLGNITGPILGSSLQQLGLRAPFFIYSGLVFLAVLVVFVFLRGDAAPAPIDRSKPSMSLREALAMPYFRALLVTGFAHGWANFGVRVALVPLLAASVATIGENSAGIALTLFALGNGIAQQFTGSLTDRFGRRPFLLLGLGISACSTLWFGWASQLWVFLSLSAVAGIGAAFIVPASQALLADLIGSNRSGGPALSAYSMSTDFGSISGTLLAGAIADAFGFGWSFALTGVILAAAIVPWFFVKGRPHLHLSLRHRRETA